MKKHNPARRVFVRLKGGTKHWGTKCQITCDNCGKIERVGWILSYLPRKPHVVGRVVETNYCGVKCVRAVFPRAEL